MGGMVREFGMNPKVGVSDPSQIETFSVSKTFARTCVRVSKMNAVACAQLTAQMLTVLLKLFISPEPVSKNMGQQMSGPDSSNGSSIRHISEGWWFQSPSGRDTFCRKYFDTLFSQEHPSVCRKISLLKTFYALSYDQQLFHLEQVFRSHCSFCWGINPNDIFIMNN